MQKIYIIKSIEGMRFEFSKRGLILNGESNSNTPYIP